MQTTNTMMDELENAIRESTTTNFKIPIQTNLTRKFDSQLNNMN